MTAGPLEDRRRDLAALVDRQLDVLVIGGGIVGSGAALDAATRGLRVGLVERTDIAVGTSSRSSRLIHGGLRYLEQYRFGLVREALTERSRILHLAPHLVTIEPLLFPLFGLPVVTRAFYQAGMTLYDVLGARKDGGWHRHLSVPEVIALAPAMRRERLRGGLLFHDGVEDDARYTLAVARTAQEDGATIVTRAGAESLVEEAGRVVGARICDGLTGEDHEIRARVVVDATGVWGADPATPLSGGSTRLLPSRGAHLIVPRSRIPSDVGLTIRVPGKVVFLVPWPHYWLVGTTDAPYAGPIDRPTAGRDEVDELLAAVNHVLDVGLRREDVVGTYAGLRPLIAPSDGSTITASREHRVVVERNGLVRVSGGKYTTYRLMAEQTIDAALGVLGERAAARPTRTTTRRLIGAADRDELDRIAGSLSSPSAQLPSPGVPLEPAVAARLVARHGTRAPDVVELGRANGLLGRLADGEEHLEAEVAWAARHELALSIDDVLARRMRIVHELPDRAAAIAPRVAAILGAELGWDETRQAAEVATFLDGARREFAVP
ncbi:MAG TPA: glycerol-3-phosphate dehydrogenase/oxidase [Verrucomicrobiae bacterium]|jgi:glycerol-3-phosphate dehydrogenase|nr:glycerol-3-phosphate dehydrogenase/oxidase [Verrucomicrobiae bacterium]